VRRPMMQRADYLAPLGRTADIGCYGICPVGLTGLEANSTSKPQAVHGGAPLPQPSPSAMAPRVRITALRSGWASPQAVAQPNFGRSPTSYTLHDAHLQARYQL
jgi:hypothetical protein